MCGLTGFVGAGGRADLDAMAAAIVHRGPDEAGFHIEPEHALLPRVPPPGDRRHRRRRISRCGTKTARSASLFNGEIYNQAELRAELLARGHVFRSDHSDTEVLVHGYEEWGEELPARLNGMFAFVIWDRPRRRLFAARDRFGEKPFFYVSRPGFFAFASELSALIRHPAVDRTIDPRALQKFFAYGYIPAPNALYRGARKLAGRMFPDARSGRFQSARAALLALRHRGRRTCARRPHSGTDRGTAGSAGPRRGAASGQRRAARCLSLRRDRFQHCAGAGRTASSARQPRYVHHRLQRTSFDESAMRATSPAPSVRAITNGSWISTRRATSPPDVLGRLDEPTGDASILPTYLLVAFARESVTVALSGDGGDELFAGYDPFAALGPATWYDRLVPPAGASGAAPAGGMLPRATTNMSLDFKLRRALMGMSYPPDVRLPVWMSPLEPARMGALFDAPMPTEELYSEAIEAWDNARAAIRSIARWSSSPISICRTTSWRRPTARR